MTWWSKLFLFLMIQAFFQQKVGALELFETYPEQRNHFLAAVRSIENDTASSWQVKVNSIETENLLSEIDLWTDFVWLKPKSNIQNRKVVVVTSGLHGIEGYVGSAVQSEMLTKNFSVHKNSTFDILIVHTVNPWGMNFKRRVNRNNVDLNRNFDQTSDLFQTQNTAYAKINNFLNPKKEFELSVFNKPLFILDSLFLILKHSMRAVRQAILQGQYQYSEGIYYGGPSRQPETQRLMSLAKELDATYDHVLWIDLHTGYGSRGKLHLLTDTEPTQNVERLQTLFPETPLDYTSKTDFYVTSGDLNGYLVREYPKKFTSVVFEYGTLDSQKTSGSIESLRRMVVENQVFFKNQDGIPFQVGGSSNAQAQNDFFRLFRPDEKDWVELVTDQTHVATQHVLKNF